MNSPQMPTTPQRLTSRLPRFLPKQFSIGAMLVLITVVACFLWWYVQLPAGTITEAQANAIEEAQANSIDFDMTKTEVKSWLGEPEKVRDGVWVYAVREKAPSSNIKRMLLVAFGDDDQIQWMEHVRESTVLH